MVCHPCAIPWCHLTSSDALASSDVLGQELPPPPQAEPDGTGQGAEGGAEADKPWVCLLCQQTNPVSAAMCETCYQPRLAGKLRDQLEPLMRAGHAVPDNRLARLRPAVGMAVRAVS